MTDTTLGDLSLIIEQLQASSPKESEIVTEYNETKSYPLSYGQQGLWFLYQLSPDSPAYNLAFTAHVCCELPDIKSKIMMLASCFWQMPRISKPILGLLLPPEV